MGKDKKLQRARQRSAREQSMQALDSAAKEALRMLYYMPGLGRQINKLDTDKAILAAPDYNYFEKMMLYHIDRSAKQALDLYNNTEGWRACDLDDIRKQSAALREDVQWLINTATSINQGDTTWSDLLAEVLRALHNGNDATDDVGPVWLEYTFVNDEGERTALGEAAAQLERYGLVVRRKRMFTASQKRRWYALEVQMQQEKEEQEGEEAEAAAEAEAADLVGTTAWQPQPQQQLDSALQAAALADATAYGDGEPDLIFPMPQQQQQQQRQGEEQLGDGGGGGDTGREGHQPAAPGDVYTAMARDLAEYEQEVAAQHQQQQQRGFATQAGAGSEVP